jgi:[acyl-carrier-protein] S-malonyltransferase
MQNMIASGANDITEVGPGKVLQGLFKKVDRKIQTRSAAI